MRWNREGFTGELLEGWAVALSLLSGLAGPAHRAGALFPYAAYAAQFVLHRGQRLAQPLGDLLVAVAFHLGDGDGTQGVVAQGVEQRPALLGHLGGKRRVGFTPDQREEQAAVLVAVWRLALDAPPVALVAALVLGQVARLSPGDDREQLPQVLQTRKPPLLGAADEAVEGAQGQVLLVGGGTGQTGLFCRARPTRAR
jgi:hypothetical protein